MLRVHTLKGYPTDQVSFGPVIFYGEECCSSALAAQANTLPLGLSASTEIPRSPSAEPVRTALDMPRVGSASSLSSSSSDSLHREHALTIAWSRASKYVRLSLARISTTAFACEHTVTNLSLSLSLSLALSVSMCTVRIDR